MQHSHLDPKRSQELASSQAQQNRFPQDQFPTTNYLAAAIKALPLAAALVSPQTIEIDAGEIGRYAVTFVARQNSGQGPPVWFWGVDRGERIVADK